MNEKIVCHVDDQVFSTAAVVQLASPQRGVDRWDTGDYRLVHEDKATLRVVHTESGVTVKVYNGLAWRTVRLEYWDSTNYSWRPAENDLEVVSNDG